jgi:hypothetical protein
MYRDVGVTVTFSAAIRSVTLVWGIDARDRVNTPRFAISSFRFDVEKPFPDWQIQSSCVGSSFRPDDGSIVSANGLFWGLGDMSNKHGALVKDRQFIDNSILLSGQFSVLDKVITLYKPNSNPKQNLGCCTIRRVGTQADPPARPLVQQAGCVWSNKETEGYIGFRSPSQGFNGVNVVVWSRFFGSEATGRHAYTINYNGFGLPQNQSPNTKCAFTLVGQVHGTGGVTLDGIGPTSVASSFGNPNFPGTVINGVGSSRARIGDLSGKHGTLKDMSPTANDEIRYSDGQLSFVGPFSIIGRSVVVYSLLGKPIGCCTIGFGPVGSSDTRLDYYDNLGNYSQPLGDEGPLEDPFDVPDPDLFGVIAADPSEAYPFWNAGRIATLAVGLAAAVLLAAAIIAAAMGGGGAGGVADAGDGYVAM